MSKHSFLGTEKISKLLFRQSLPAAVGMLVMSLYNIVDTIFIGRGVGTLGIAGLAISFPIHMLVIATSQTIGFGSASIISRALGAKNYKRAEQTLGNYITLVLIFSMIITALGIAFLRPILSLFGATEAVMPYAASYMSIILYGTVFLAFTASGNSIIRSEGNAKFAMIIMIVSALLNVILDPIFIFTLDMGMRGAAIATVISQVAASLLSFHYFFRGRSGIHIHMKNFRLRWTLVKEVFAVGSSSLARMGSSSLMFIVLNHSLGRYGGDIAIAAFGILGRFLMLVITPLVGIGQGLQPILGYNYGARNYSRSKSSIMLAVKSATAVSVFMFLILFLFSRQAVSIFTTDPALIGMSVRALRIIMFMLPLLGVQIIGAGLFQAIGKALPALFLSLARQVILLIPLVLILPLFFQLLGVWISFPVSDLLSTGVTIIMMKKEFSLLDTPEI